MALHSRNSESRWTAAPILCPAPKKVALLGSQIGGLDKSVQRTSWWARWRPRRPARLAHNPSKGRRGGLFCDADGGGGAITPATASGAGGDGQIRITYKAAPAAAARRVAVALITGALELTLHKAGRFCAAHRWCMGVVRVLSRVGAACWPGSRTAIKG
jgi:hypothetical protein